ncbi:hypothetical protein [Phosphitispora sp. TUW77]|uniref:hypothetical protein n=1 Tax=Phosphitispora sp. TUW77 TaxID=3152361 RepID=UPI003AB87F3D
MISIGIVTALWLNKRLQDCFLGLIYLVMSSFIAFGITPWISGANQVYVIGGDSVSFPEGLGISVFIGFLLSGFFYIIVLAVINIKQLVTKRFTS